MNKKVLSFNKFNEQVDVLAGSTGSPTPDPASNTQELKDLKQKEKRNQELQHQ